MFSFLNALNHSCSVIHASILSFIHSFICLCSCLFIFQLHISICRFMLFVCAFHTDLGQLPRWCRQFPCEPQSPSMPKNVLVWENYALTTYIYIHTCVFPSNIPIKIGIYMDLPLNNMPFNREFPKTPPKTGVGFRAPSRGDEYAHRRVSWGGLRHSSSRQGRDRHEGLGGFSTRLPHKCGSVFSRIGWSRRRTHRTGEFSKHGWIAEGPFPHFFLDWKMRFQAIGVGGVFAEIFQANIKARISWFRGEMWVLSVLPGKIRTAVNFLPLLDVLVVCWCFPPSLVESPWVIQSCWLLFPRLPQSIGSQGLIRSMPIFEKNGPNMSKQRAAIVPCSRGLVTFDANWVALCSHLRHPCSLATWSPRSPSAEDHPR